MESEPESGEGGGTAGGRGQRLWAVLLVLDAFFVVIFGGALAAKVYEHWQSPPPTRLPSRAAKSAAPVLPPAPRAEKLEPVGPVTETAKTTPPPEALAKASEPVKPSEPAKKTVAAEPAPKAAKAAPTADTVKLPKPSLIQEAPKRRETPKPQETAKKPAPAQAPASTAAAGAPAPKKEAEATSKAVAVDFQLKAPGAKSVELGGAFLVRGGGRKAMVRHSDGVWTLTVYLTPNTYRYYFLVDGKKTLDPGSPKKSRGASLLTVAAP